MEGFVSTNSVFEQEFRHTRYNAYSNAAIQNKNREDTNVHNKNKLTSNNSTYGQNQINNATLTSNLKDALNTEFINSTINSFDKTIIDTVTDDRNDKKHSIRKAFIVGGSTLLFGGMTMLLTRGKISKRITSLTTNIIEKTNEKIKNIKEKPEISNIEELYLSSLQLTNKGLGRIRGAFFNISPFKDVLFEKIVREKLGLGKICDSITNTFKKVSFGTVKAYYKNASKNMDNMTQVFENTNQRITNGEFGTDIDTTALKKANQRLIKIKESYSENFSEQKVLERTENVAKSFKGLGSKIYNSVYGNFKNFVKNIDDWTTFISEKFVSDKKEIIIKNLEQKKRIITYSPADISKNLNNNINSLEQITKGKTTRNILKQLKSLSKEYSKTNETESRQNIMKNLKETLENGRQKIETENCSSQDKATITKILNEIENILTFDKKGEIEELLTYYKSILPTEDYEKLKQSAQKAIDSLNKAVHNEGFNYTDKLRDLSVGSALTDVAIGMGLPLIITGIAVTAANTKEEKQSVILKYGIPLLVGVSTASACALRLISGGKALILGAITSTITNNICEHIDKKLKNKSNNNLT